MAEEEEDEFPTVEELQDIREEIDEKMHERDLLQADLEESEEDEDTEELEAQIADLDDELEELADQLATQVQAVIDEIQTIAIH
jgi:hypothetical protein